MSDAELTLTYDAIVHTTDKARLFRFGEEDVWIPESQILWIDEDARDVLLPEWLVEAKGLEAYES